MNTNLDNLSETIEYLANPQSLPLTQDGRIRKHIALVAHDNKKRDLLEWARYNRDLLVQHELYTTGTTGRLLSEVLEPGGLLAERSAGRRPAG
jgi:hypothetical protein